MNAASLVQETAGRFLAAGLPDAAKEAEFLVCELLAIDRKDLFSRPLPLDDNAIILIRNAALRRSNGEPFQYIVGNVDFMGLSIAVGPGVLIPRPETELLVEEAIKSIQDSWIGKREKAVLGMLDLCTGSGCVALSLAKHFPEAVVVGTDISPAALVYARRNAALNSIGSASFLEGDLFGPVAGRLFQCITANPPYVRSDEIPELQREVREHEPLNALNGGIDGMDYYRRILAEAPGYLEAGGLLIMELGYDQADEISGIAYEAGFSDIECIADYSGIRRIFCAERT